ncbi:DNA adenine methylase [Desulfitibacter alkalitolerans]|uniref:DNA adenine methylase n=1 Tax=Desulfitibacter alkalitolerans TaxID=264641 RepID=UPI000482DF85|nr:DNA adenine methylase [Desulfitibacter alkalitolerans]
MAINKLVTPVVKWVGGKRQIINQIVKYIPKSFSTYYEPFLGGGAVLFELQPKTAVVNDINAELINLYEVIKNNVNELIDDLKQHRNDETYFYELRELDRNKEYYNHLTPIQRASRLIYLNKTCYNGLFRVNKAGQFNTPFGNYKNPNIVNEYTLKAVSSYFNKAQITFTCKDFNEALKGARKGAFVYLDPPYDPVSDSASFTGYDKGGFDQSEQIRLKNACDKLNEKGIKFLLSNSATDFIKDLYKDYKIEIIQAKRVINSKADKRGEIDEVLVMNFE